MERHVYLLLSVRYSSAGAAILSHQILRVVRKKNSYFQSPSTQMSAGMFFSFSAESLVSSNCEGGHR